MMKIELEPIKSKMGIKQTKHEFFVNNKGKLSVIFRYKNDDLSVFSEGYQVQYETIECNEYRGNHYHYPELAGEEFYLIGGNAVLIASNLDNSIIEMYLLKEQNTYYVPALIPHKVQNLSHFYNNREEVRLIIAKHYNYKIENLQKTHVIPSEITDRYIEQLIKKNTNEL